ncbi:flagellin [Alphaproteobacteria bacterium]|nr:flagellin [Alphaproteobacteria bacterium]
MTVINTNVGALTARTYALKAGDSMNKAMERLSSGLRINSAADDAAGLAVANKMESQLRGMNVAIRNSQDGISLVQTAEAGMSEISNMVIRMRELAVQMNNGIYTSTDRSNAQLEITALLAEVDKIATNTAFNDVKVLDGTYSADIRAGNTNAEVINVSIERMNTDALGGVNLAGTKTVATADNSTAVNKIGTTSYTATESASVTIKANDYGVGIKAFAAANANGTYTLSGTDAASFQLDANNNLVSKAGIAFDTGAVPKNSYSVKLTYTNQAGTSSFDENVTLNIAQNKALATVKSASTNLTTSESASVSFRSTNSSNATDGILSSDLQAFVTADKGAGTYSITGVDAAQISIDANTGVVSASLDFENKKDAGTNNVYDFNVVYTASSGDKFNETVALTVTNSQEEATTFTTTSVASSVTRSDVFNVTVGSGSNAVNIKAVVGADDAAFTATKLVNLLNSENAQLGAAGAKGSFSVDANSDIKWTFADSVGNIANTERPATITQTDKTVSVGASTTTEQAQKHTFVITDAQVAASEAANDTYTLTVGGETLTVTDTGGNANTIAAVRTLFTSADTSALAFTVGGTGNNIEVVMKDKGATLSATPTLTNAASGGAADATFNTAAAAADVFTLDGRSLGREAVAKVVTYGGLGASLNSTVTGDTFDVTIGGTNIRSTVGASVTAGSYGIASLVTDLNAANQALATPVAVTFSANGGDLVATAVNANDNLAMTSAVQRNDGDVGTVTLTTRSAAAVKRTIDFTSVGTPGNTTDQVEVTINGAVFTTRKTGGVGSADNAGIIAALTEATAGQEAVDAAGNKFNDLYGVTQSSQTASTLRFTAKVAGTARNADVVKDLTFVAVTAVNVGTVPTSVDGVDSLVSVAATKVGNSVAGTATSALGGDFADLSKSFVTTTKSSIAMTEASKLEFGTNAMSAALNTYRTSSGQTGGTFSLSGTDSSKFSIDKTSGLVKNVSDMDADTVASYNFNVIYTDKAGGKFTEEVALSLTNNVADDGSHITNVDLTSQGSANTSISILDKAINQIASAQAKLGAIQNRLQHNIDNLSAASMLTETAKGRIVDADFARETTELSKQQILSQAATSMLAQANQSKQSVLALLQ